MTRGKAAEQEKEKNGQARFHERLEFPVKGDTGTGDEVLIIKGTA
jgi:hypothetical protein